MLRFADIVRRIDACVERLFTDSTYMWVLGSENRNPNKILADVVYFINFPKSSL